MNPGNSQQALAQLQQTQATAYNPNDILANRRQELGVNAAQDTVTGLRGAINNSTKLLSQVAPSVMGRTQDSLVTNAQAGRIIQNEQAPIAQNLTTQGTQYNQANEDLGRLEGQAGEQAQAYERGQNDRISYAQNLYNTLYQREQDAQQAQQAELDRQEQIRRFNTQAIAQRSAASASAAGPSTFNLGAPTPTASAPKATAQQRQGGGYNFVDTSGKAVSAGTYAALTGQSIGNVLYSMGQSGDKYAQQAYNQIKNNQEYYNRNPGALKQEFSSLFWGT